MSRDQQRVLARWRLLVAGLVVWGAVGMGCDLRALKGDYRTGILIQPEERAPQVLLGPVGGAGHGDLINRADAIVPGGLDRFSLLWAGEMKIRRGLFLPREINETSGTVFRLMQLEPRHQNSVHNLISAIAQFNPAILTFLKRVEEHPAKTKTEFSIEEEHLHPALLGRHSGNGALLAVSGAVELHAMALKKKAEGTLPANLRKDPTNLRELAAGVGASLSRVRHFVEALENDGVITRRQRRKLQEDVDHLSAEGQLPNLEATKARFLKLQQKLNEFWKRVNDFIVVIPLESRSP